MNDNTGKIEYYGNFKNGKYDGQGMKYIIWCLIYWKLFVLKGNNIIKITNWSFMANLKMDFMKKVLNKK